jgi:hypothetical protein
MYMYMLTGKTERYDPLTGFTRTVVESFSIKAQSREDVMGKIHASTFFNSLREKEIEAVGFVC